MGSTSIHAIFALSLLLLAPSLSLIRACELERPPSNYSALADIRGEGNAGNQLRRALEATNSTTRHRREVVLPPAGGKGELPFYKGRFVDWTEVGQGAFGIVYKARDALQKGKFVAIKAVQDERMQKSEVTSHAAISRSGFTRVPLYLGSFRGEGKTYVVREYLDGVTFHEYMRGGARQLRKETVASIIYQLTYALSVFHQNGFAHNDLHGRNVMVVDVGDDGEAPLVKLIDFGLVSPIGSHHHMWSLEVTPALDICTLGNLMRMMDPSKGMMLAAAVHLHDDIKEHSFTASQLGEEFSTLVEATTEVCFAWQDGGVHLSTIDILNHPFVKLGKELASEWPFYECRGSK